MADTSAEGIFKWIITGALGAMSVLMGIASWLTRDKFKGINDSIASGDKTLSERMDRIQTSASEMERQVHARIDRHEQNTACSFGEIQKLFLNIQNRLGGIEERGKSNAENLTSMAENFNSLVMNNFNQDRFHNERIGDTK